MPNTISDATATGTKAPRQRRHFDQPAARNAVSSEVGASPPSPIAAPMADAIGKSS
jgi:hypothetical protein